MPTMFYVEQPVGVGYSVADAGMTSLIVYNLLGQQVRTLARSYCLSGYHTAVWDGCDTAGRPVASGTYLVRLTRGDAGQVRRMAFVR